MSPQETPVCTVSTASSTPSGDAAVPQPDNSNHTAVPACAEDLVEHPWMYGHQAAAEEQAAAQPEKR